MQSENIFSLFAFTKDGHRDYFVRVLGKFDGYFVPRTNVTHERACFHMRVKRQGQKAEIYQGFMRMAENFEI